MVPQDHILLFNSLTVHGSAPQLVDRACGINRLAVPVQFMPKARRSQATLAAKLSVYKSCTGSFAKPDDSFREAVPTPNECAWAAKHGYRHSISRIPSRHRLSRDGRECPGVAACVYCSFLCPDPLPLPLFLTLCLTVFLILSPLPSPHSLPNSSLLSPLFYLFFLSSLISFLGDGPPSSPPHVPLLISLHHSNSWRVRPVSLPDQPAPTPGEACCRGSDVAHVVRHECRRHTKSRLQASLVAVAVRQGRPSQGEPDGGAPRRGTNSCVSPGQMGVWKTLLSSKNPRALDTDTMLMPLWKSSGEIGRLGDSWAMLGVQWNRTVSIGLRCQP